MVVDLGLKVVNILHKLRRKKHWKSDDISNEAGLSLILIHVHACMVLQYATCCSDS